MYYWKLRGNHITVFLIMNSCVISKIELKVGYLGPSETEHWRLRSMELENLGVSLNVPPVFPTKLPT